MPLAEHWLSGFLFGTKQEIWNLLRGPKGMTETRSVEVRTARQYARMSIRDLGSIESDQGNFVPARWNEDTGVVELRVYQFPLQGEAHWAWMRVGIAPTLDAALATAENYLGRGQRIRAARGRQLGMKSDREAVAFGYPSQAHVLNSGPGDLWLSATDAVMKRRTTSLSAA